MYCMYCGKALDDNCRFCTHCGKPLHAPAAAEEPVQASPERQAIPVTKAPAAEAPAEAATTEAAEIPAPAAAAAPEPPVAAKTAAPEGGQSNDAFRQAPETPQPAPEPRRPQATYTAPLPMRWFRFFRVYLIFVLAVSAVKNGIEAMNTYLFFNPDAGFPFPISLQPLFLWQVASFCILGLLLLFFCASMWLWSKKSAAFCLIYMLAAITQEVLFTGLFVPESLSAWTYTVGALLATLLIYLPTYFYLRRRRSLLH